MKPLPLTYDGRIIRDARRDDCAAECAPFYEAPDPIRRMERASIRWWMEQQQEHLRGRVLDYGAGKPGTCYQPQPYRDLVAGEYVPYDLGDHLPGGWFDAVMFTQAIQYMESPARTLALLHSFLRSGGRLLMTGPSSWPELEGGDMWRYTRAGITRLVQEAGFVVEKCEERAMVTVGVFGFSLGWGLVAVRP